MNASLYTVIKKQLVNLITLAILLTLLSTRAYGNENEINRQVLAIGGLKSVAISPNTQTMMTNSVVGKSKSDMKELIKKQNSTTTNQNLITTSLTHSDFGIYGASSFLEVDIDFDGYYQSFSVLFDADFYGYHEITGPQVEVYALLYISRNGEPWSHFFTTDNFIINGDSELDEYEVNTTLVSGYPPGEYDILIDLYQVGYSNIVASFSANDSNALYALPLESSDFDSYYVEEVDVIGGGANNRSSLLILLMLFLFRTYLKTPVQ